MIETEIERKERMSKLIVFCQFFFGFSITSICKDNLFQSIDFLSEL